MDAARQAAVAPTAAAEGAVAGAAKGGATGPHATVATGSVSAASGHHAALHPGLVGEEGRAVGVVRAEDHARRQQQMHKAAAATYLMQPNQTSLYKVIFYSTQQIIEGLGLSWASQFC